jgi:hypothetical protein
MSVIWADSFSGYATADLGAKYDTNSGSLSIGASSGPRGAGALLASGNPGNSTWQVEKLTPSAQAEFYVAFRYYFTTVVTSPALIQLVDGTTLQLYLRHNASGNTLSVVQGNGTVLGTTASLSANTWYHVELYGKINNSTGAYTLRLNEVTAISGTGLDTQNSGNATADRFRVGLGFTDNPYNLRFADLVVADGTNGQTFIGDKRVDWSGVTGAGTTTQFTPSTGSNYQCVDDATPNGDTDYVEDGTVGHTDTYAVADAPATAASIVAVVWAAEVRKTDAGSRTVYPTYRIGSTNYNGTAATVLDTYRILSQVAAVSPATSSAWTVSEFNAAEVGQTVAS